jgi:hypothetical protein
MRQIVFSNISLTLTYQWPSWWGAAEPIYVTAVSRGEGTRVRVIFVLSGPLKKTRLRASPIQAMITQRNHTAWLVKVGLIHGVSFADIAAESENGIFLAGSVGSLLQNVRLERILLLMKNKTRCGGISFPCMWCGTHSYAWKGQG